MNTRVTLDRFDRSENFSRGASLMKVLTWHFVKMIFFLSAFPWPASLKRTILRLFGCRVGKEVVIKPRVNIHFPWKLTIGDHVWIGEEVFILNFAQVDIGSHVCLSQRVFLCAGNHDFRQPSMPYRNRPIMVEAGAWVGAQVFVAPGVCVGVDTVVAAGSVLLKNADSGRIYSGNPATAAGFRWRDAM